MQTVLARRAGFCGGVRRAVSLAKRLASRGKPVFCDGPLIHNEDETARLDALGVHVCTAPETLPRGTSILVPAHGIAPERRRWLESLGLNIHDATCPVVQLIQRQCAIGSIDGRFVLILGDAGHAEVVGLSGFAGERSAVVSGPGDIAALPEPGVPVSLVAQSTQSESTLAETWAAVRARWPNALFFDTICRSARERRASLEELARECDAIAVVGSYSSANTLRLLQAARALRPAALVESAETLDESFFRAYSCVGITAGASTPDSAIAAARCRLEAIPSGPCTT